jgi:hypothetical protein
MCFALQGFWGQNPKDDEGNVKGGIRGTIK